MIVAWAWPENRNSASGNRPPSGNGVFRGRGKAGGAQSRCKHVADFRAGRFQKLRRAHHWIAERLFDWSGVPTVHLRPTFFSEWLSLPFVRSTIVENGIIDLPYGDGRHAPIAAEDQARVIATILAKPAAHVGKTYTLCGPTELDQAGIAAAISEVLGRKISYEPLTIPQYRERLEKAGLSEFMIQHFVRGRPRL
jgi:uncharacterized protein YbjT (DUF2867 family)